MASVLKVGDLVARSYAWPELVSGIIIDCHEDQVRGIPECKDGGYPYSEITYTVAWADGTVSRELDLEIESFEEMLKVDRGENG